MRSWFNWMIVGLIAAMTADAAFGLDAVLNAISTIIAIGAVIAVAGVGGAAIAALGWVVIRDAMDEIGTDRRNGRAWRWRLIGWLGILGVFADGIVGTWNAYQEHVLFSTAVEEIPFAGVPVLLALASYPLKRLEDYLMNRRGKARRPGEPYGAG